MKKIFLLISIFSCFFGCSKSTPVVYQVGVDHSFFPLNLGEQTLNVFAFTDELFSEISKIKNIELNRILFSWDNLIEGLYLEKTVAITSPAPPNLINDTKYFFSDPYIYTGPVLVTPLSVTSISLESLSGRTVAMGKSPEELDLMQRYPEVEFIIYDSLVDALNSVSKGEYAAALIPILQANTYIRDLYSDSLEISSNVLTTQAIRLMSLKASETQLIKTFNEGLIEVKKNGTYTALLTKWSLSQ